MNAKKEKLKGQDQPCESQELTNTGAFVGSEVFKKKVMLRGVMLEGDEVAPSIYVLMWLLWSTRPCRLGHAAHG